MAMDFRAAYQKDVVIDMWCYRKHGHNEGDEPAFTQPLMYRAIRDRKSVREGYLENLLKLGEITLAEAKRIESGRITQTRVLYAKPQEDDDSTGGTGTGTGAVPSPGPGKRPTATIKITREHADAFVESRNKELEEHLEHAQDDPQSVSAEFGKGVWTQYVGGRDELVPDATTSIAEKSVDELMTALAQTPASFTPHAKLKKFLEQRAEMGRGERPFDWGGGEALAFASLLADGTNVRVSGRCRLPTRRRPSRCRSPAPPARHRSRCCRGSPRSGPGHRPCCPAGR
jgi:2-oxoglutarate dehydrogenase E1 component